MLGKFGNVNHSIFAWQNLYECSERHDSNNSAGVLVTNFNILSKGVDCCFGFLGVLTVGRTNDDCTIVLNVDRDTEFVDHSTNYRSTRTDDCADLVGRNLEREHSRCVLAEIISGCRDSCFHIVENLQSSDPSLLKSLRHDLERDSLYLNVHLQCGNTFSCPCNLEVHVTRVVFRTLDIGKNCVLGFVVLVCDESHCDTGDGCRNRHTTVHHCEGSGTYAGHRS